MNRRILFVPFGSEGDVNPLLWLAGHLAGRGHQPVFLLTPHYGHLAAKRGFEWHPIGTEEDFHRMAGDPGLWKPGLGTWRVAQAMPASLATYQNAFDALDWLKLNRAWGIESGLHQRLDVSHLDDLSRVRKPTSMLFMGMFRRLSNSLCLHWISKQPRPHHKTPTAMPSAPSSPPAPPFPQLHELAVGRSSGRDSLIAMAFQNE